MFNYGCNLRIDERDNSFKLQSQFRTDLPPFGIYISSHDDGILYLCFKTIQTIGTDDDREIFLAYLIDNHTFDVSEGETISHFDLSMDGTNHRIFSLWPFGMEEHPSKVVVPFLPVEERDAMYWRKVADAYGLALGTPTKTEEDTVAYKVLTNNPNVKSLIFSSYPRHDPTGDLIVEARFKEAVRSEEFQGFQRLFGGRTYIQLDGKHVVSGQFKGNSLHAEIPKGRNFLASGLISYIDSMK